MWTLDGHLDMSTRKSNVLWFFWPKMEVTVQLSRSEELKTHATIFEAEMRVGMKKNECGWGLSASVFYFHCQIFLIYAFSDHSISCLTSNLESAYSVCPEKVFNIKIEKKINMGVITNYFLSFIKSIKLRKFFIIKASFLKILMILKKKIFAYISSFQAVQTFFSSAPYFSTSLIIQGVVCNTRCVIG